MEFALVGGVAEARQRLGNTGNIRRELADVVNESARLGSMLAKEEAPFRTRALQGAIVFDESDRTPTGAIEAVVGVHRTLRAGLRLGPDGNEDAYPYYVHEGTGLYGEYNRMIKPTRAKAMTWFDKFGYMRRTRTRGQRPNPYMERAFEELAHSYIPQRIDLMVRRIFGR
jgi:hypothetical protein